MAILLTQEILPLTLVVVYFHSVLRRNRQLTVSVPHETQIDCLIALNLFYVYFVPHNEGIVAITGGVSGSVDSLTAYSRVASKGWG